MPTLLEEPVSTLAPALPATASFAVLVVAVIAMMVRYMSPLRLTSVLIAVIADAEETYIEAHGVGPLPAAETEALYILQLKVSAIVEETLNHSPPGARQSAIFSGVVHSPCSFRRVDQVSTTDVEGISAAHRE